MNCWACLHGTSDVLLRAWAKLLMLSPLVQSHVEDHDIQLPLGPLSCADCELGDPGVPGVAPHIFAIILKFPSVGTDVASLTMPAGRENENSTKMLIAARYGNKHERRDIFEEGDNQSPPGLHGEITQGLK